MMKKYQTPAMDIFRLHDDVITGSCDPGDYNCVAPPDDPADLGLDPTGSVYPTA